MGGVAGHRRYGKQARTGMLDHLFSFLFFATGADPTVCG